MLVDSKLQLEREIKEGLLGCAQIGLRCALKWNNEKILAEAMELYEWADKLSPGSIALSPVKVYT